MTKNLDNKFSERSRDILNYGRKILTYGAVGTAMIGLVACAPEDSKKKDNPQPIPNRAPVAELYVSPTSGNSPLEIRIQLNCTDPDNNLKNYIVTIDGETIQGNSPIDITRTLTQSKIVSGQCVDSENSADSKTQNVSVTQPAPVLTQSAVRQGDTDIQYNASLNNIYGNATLEIYHEGNLWNTRTITTSTYSENFLGMKKGDWKFVLSAVGLNGENISETDDDGNEDVPNFNPTFDLSSIDADFDEDAGKNIQLPLPFDRNPEDNPVQYASVVSSDGKTNASITPDGNLTINNIPGQTGNYQLGFNFGSADGGIASASLNGEIYNLPDFSGFVKNNETDTGVSLGKIRAYVDEGNGTYRRFGEFETDANGNFNFRINESGLQEIILQARSYQGVNEDSFVRTVRKSGTSDIENLVMTVVPYTNLAENGVTPTQFKTFMGEIQPDYIYKWDFSGLTSTPFQGIEIVDVNPLDNISTFTLGEQETIKNNFLDPTGANCYFEGRLQDQNIQIDNQLSQKHYTVDWTNNKIIPHEGWGIIISSPDTGGFAGLTSLEYNARGIKSGLIKINPAYKNTLGLDIHEGGHLSIAPYGHTFSLNSQQSMMTEPFSLQKPSQIDCKAGKLVYEPDYNAMDPEFPRFLGEEQKNILGLNFLTP